MEDSINGRCTGPTNPYVEFKKEEIEQSIADRFEQQVSKYPDRVAAKAKDRELTYDALNKFANRLARAILGEETGKDEPIAVLLEHDACLLAAILGILKAGRVFVPLDPYLLYERNNYILDDSGAVTIVTSDKNQPLADSLSRNRRRVINIDEIDSGLAVENLTLPISSNTVAYVLYTSGSTGQPKGVIQNHRNALHDTMQFTNALHV